MTERKRKVVSESSDDETVDVKEATSPVKKGKKATAGASKAKDTGKVDKKSL